MSDDLAARDASDLVRLLEPACERISVAGSVRRRCDNVKDLDLVLVPKAEGVAAPGQLFDAVRVDAIDARIAELISLPNAALSRPRDANNGPRQKELRFRGRKVELWIVRPPATWGVIFTLRTGPAAFSHLLVTPEAAGGAMPVDMRVSAGRLLHAGREVPTPEEGDFFRAIEVPPFPAHRRTVDALRRVIDSRKHA